MSWIVTHIKWIMLVSGTLTTTMIYAAISPEGALQATFGESLTGPGATLVVRSWGVLIALVGGMLLYGAFHPPVRSLALTVAAASKATFIALVLSHGDRFLRYQAGMAVVIDGVMVLLFAWYLLAAPHGVDNVKPTRPLVRS